MEQTYYFSSVFDYFVHAEDGTVQQPIDPVANPVSLQFVGKHDLARNTEFHLLSCLLWHCQFNVHGEFYLQQTQTKQNVGWKQLKWVT